ncbi:unnamed protein product [Tuber melanosporum]|uniref:(Perigord truffle) hypothetical protein n=1 Tax=Tuber melanosporum (strain Mel28) TaxID=656061 RepID=D5GBU4_TUBMM|nr:uncharacterized protein GSTUM_00005589001 [Tuber melanosporum]CAZ81944.1 unnamed protein product [Tuber melanosporum]
MAEFCCIDDSGPIGRTEGRVNKRTPNYNPLRQQNKTIA